MISALKKFGKGVGRKIGQSFVRKTTTPGVAGTTPEAIRNAGPNSPEAFYAAQAANNRAIAEERASASLSAPPKSGVSGLFATAPTQPSVQNNPFYNPHAATAVNRNIKERTGAWLKGSNAPIGTIGTALGNSSYLNKIREAARGKKLTKELQTNPAYLNGISSMARRNQKPGAGAAGGRRTRRRKTHRRKTHKRHRSNK